jgi:hypothetical protein
MNSNVILIYEKFGLDTNQIIKHLENRQDVPWQASNVYVVATQEKVIDTSLRKSQFRSIVGDQELFDECEKIIAEFNKENEVYSFSIVRNDAMHIKYDKGDYFKEHSDFLSLNSNIFEEFTLIICVLRMDSATNIVGGETKVVLNDESAVISKSTTTPGGALLFRKDLLHTGLELKEGVKEILMLNVWATRKPSSKHLVVLFPNANSTSTSSPAVDLDAVSSHINNSCRTTNAITKDQFESKLRRERDKCYVISATDLADFEESFFWRFINFQANVDDGSKSIVTYICTVCSFEQFDLVYRVLTRQRINDDVQVNVEALRLLDFFAVNQKKALIDSVQRQIVDKPVANDQNEELPQMMHVYYPGNRELKMMTAEEFVAEHHQRLGVEPVHSLIPVANASSADFTTLIQDDYVVFDCEERAVMFKSLARNFNLPYVPFHIVFCEGAQAYSDDDSGRLHHKTNIGLVPVLVTVGDYDNIFGIRNVIRADKQSLLTPFHKGGPIIDDVSIPDDVERVRVINDDDISKQDCEKYTILELSKESYTQSKKKRKKTQSVQGEPELKSTTSTKEKLGVIEFPEHQQDQMCGFGLCFSATNFSIHEIVQNCVLAERSYGSGAWYRALDLLYLPGGRDCTKKCSRFCHLDSKGKICFDKEEAKATKEYITRSRLIDRVRKQLVDQQIKLRFSQSRNAIATSYCNEVSDQFFDIGAGKVRQN